MFWFKTVQLYNVHVNGETEHIRPEVAKKQNKNKANKQQTLFFKTRLRITAYAITDGGSGWIPKALLNFQQIVGVEEYFFL